MIRRDGSAAAEAPGRWILISQIEHACLAARLAEHWNSPGFAPLMPRRELLWAVEHHDDGWREWEMAPGIDPANGRPRSFSEMEPADSAAIWSSSIDEAADQGPLEAYLVASHFSALARRATLFSKSADNKRVLETFVAHHAPRIDARLADWMADNRAENTADLAQRDLALLQMFDALSLWFCCAPNSVAEQVETPAGPPLTLTPIDLTSVQLAPWPLDVPSLALSLSARTVPVARYQNCQELAAAPLESIQLNWQLSSGSVQGS